MKKNLILIICLVFLLVLSNRALALEGKIKDISIEKKEDTVKVILSTEGTLNLIAYDILQPPQVIIDVIGDGLTNVDENIAVHFGAIEQIKVVKTSFADKDYYGVDFWVVQLTEPVDYKLSKSDNTYILTLAKSKVVKLDKKEIIKKQIVKPEATKPELSKDSKEPPLVSIPPITPATHKPLEKAIQLRQKGYRYQIDKDYNKALAYYQKAIQVDPYYATAHNDLGVIYYMYLGDTEKAIEEFKKALEINPNYLGAHTNLALIYEDLGRKEAAIKHWAERARLGDPEDYWTKLAKQKLEESIE